MIYIVQQIVSIFSSDSQLQTLLGGTAGDRRIKPQVPGSPEETPVIVHDVVGSSRRTVPINVDDTTLQLRIYAVDIMAAENIFTRMDFLLNYYKKTNSPKIQWMVREVKTNEPETDRSMQVIVTRYRIWSINS